jgi:6-phosphogluconolactonase
MTQVFSVFVSNAADGEISAYRFDTTSGKLEANARYQADDNVMPLALSPEGARLYAATRGARPSIVTYALDAQRGTLAREQATPIDSNLAYLCADATGRYLLGASYGEDRASLYDAARIAQGEGQALRFADDIKHAHSVISTRDGRFAYVASLGADTLHVFELTDGKMHALEVVVVDRNFGPRHLRFSPDETTLYVVSEFRATVAAYKRDAATGKLGAMSMSDRPEALSHLGHGRVRPVPANAEPVDLGKLIWAADIQLTPDGRFVYVCERTSSRLITYRAESDGALRYAGFVDTEAQPRGFRIDPTGRFLIACGEKSSHVAAYAIDPDTGALSLLSRCEGGRGANWIEIVAQS